MEIGAPIRTIVVEPLEEPVPVRLPQPDPERADEPERLEGPVW
jgi:hypothetical protein